MAFAKRARAAKFFEDLFSVHSRWIDRFLAGRKTSLLRVGAAHP